MSSKVGKIRLRDAETKPRCFWKRTTTEQNAQVVHDQNADYGRRILTSNETTALALNEIAIARRRGYFFHLPSRQSWTARADANRLPLARVPGLSSPSYPAIIFQDFIWDDISSLAFNAAPQRARYLQSSALINPPSDVPLIGIQYATYYRSAVYLTPVESLVVYAVPYAFYVLTSSEAASIFGCCNRQGLLNNSVNLWNSDSWGSLSAERLDQLDQVRTFQLQTIEAVYARIVAYYHQSLDGSKMTGAALQELIPRPARTSAMQVGRLLGAGSRADAPSRRGEVRKSGPRRRNLDESDADRISNNDFGDEDEEEDGDQDEDEDEDMVDVVDGGRDKHDNDNDAIADVVGRATSESGS